ncbi:MAG: homoserine O-succinyltransferase, partial [Chromatiales bacterium]|nr:homoserine O-succinyltransferase [Chromatiales bacterium]
HFHGVARRRCLPDKRWGVYEPRNVASHPLVSNLNTRFDAPHSHVYEMTRADVEPAGVQVLSESEDAGIYLAVSADGFRFVFFQGHPEYDKVSLAKEYKREVTRFVAGERETYPGYPERYFTASAREMLDRHRAAVTETLAGGATPPAFPDAKLEPLLDNTWADTGKAMFNNWLGLVYQLTDVDRRKPLMASLDPDDPLGLKTA